MHIRPIISYSVVLVLLLGLAGCNSGEPAAVTQISDLEYTQAVQTIAAELTKRAPQVTVASDAQLPGSTAAAVEIVIQTNTPEPSETLPPTSTPRPTETPLPSETPTPDFTPTDTATPEPAWDLVYEDSMKSGFWVNASGKAYQLLFANGGYSIYSDVKNDIVFSVRKEPYSNVRLEVDTERIGGPSDAYFGLICNFQNSGNYHFLGIGVDGWYGIGVKQGSQMRFIEEGKDQSGAIKTGEAPNTLRADCMEGKLTLWVNGIQIASANDSTFTEGMAGVGAGNRAAAGVQVVFTNFQVFSTKTQP